MCSLIIVVSHVLMVVLVVDLTTQYLSLLFLLSFRSLRLLVDQVILPLFVKVNELTQRGSHLVVLH